MQRTWLSRTSLVACALAFATAPLLAQQDARDAAARQGEKQSQAKQRQRGDKQAQSDTQQTPEQKEAIKHFLAGYYSGYVDGWSDGAQDLVITVLDEQRRRVRQQVAAGRDPGQMQQGRAAARAQMRNRMRGEADRKQVQTQQKRSVSVSGEVIGIKTVSVADTKIEHRVARVRGENGRVLIVELGPKSQTDKLGLKNGDMIQVRGALATAGDFQILVAQQVTSGDQKTEIKYKKLSPDKRRRDVNAPNRNQRGQADPAAEPSQNQPRKNESRNAQ